MSALGTAGGLLEIARRFNIAALARDAWPIQLQADDTEDGRSVLFLLDLNTEETLSALLDLPSPRPPQTSAALLELQLRGLLCFPRAGEALH